MKYYKILLRASESFQRLLGLNEIYYCGLIKSWSGGLNYFFEIKSLS